MLYFSNLDCHRIYFQSPSQTVINISWETWVIQAAVWKCCPGHIIKQVTLICDSFYFILFILFYLILFYFILSYFISFHFISFHLILFHFILSYFILSYFISFHFTLFYFVLFLTFFYFSPLSAGLLVWDSNKQCIWREICQIISNHLIFRYFRF